VDGSGGHGQIQYAACRLRLPTAMDAAHMRDIERKKLFEAAAFFLKYTKYCGLVKLFKLLYFLDMLNFRETGRTVTGLVYTALPYGPVPLSLYDEFQAPKGDLAATFTVKSPPRKEEQLKAPLTEISPKQPLADRYLTVREKRICKELADIFLEATADQMSNVSHATGGPWDKAQSKSPDGWKQIIDFFDALSPTLKMGSGKALPKELLKARAAEFDEDKKAFG
jgi:uncharacterized phage-associated protein